MRFIRNSFLSDTLYLNLHEYRIKARILAENLIGILFDDVVGNTLTPASCLNASDQNEQKYNLKGINADPTTTTGDKQDPDKIFRQYPSFDPVFMKV
jgi:hypothetical protein